MTATDRTTRRTDALHDALADRRRSEATDYPRASDTDPLTRPQLIALTENLDILAAKAARAITQSAGVDDAVAVLHLTPTGVEVLRRAAAVARAAASHGYPRPPLEQLGAQAAHLPAARTSDPHTARDSGETTRQTPTARNHLGKLLVGLLMYEHQEVRIAKQLAYENGEDVNAAAREADGALTSEEIAHRVGLSGAEYAKRCSDLQALGYIRVAKDDNGHDRTRRGDSGRQRLVFELTDDGRVMASRISWADEHDRG